MKPLTWTQLTCIQLGGVIAIPLVSIGFTVGKILPGLSGIAVCIEGNFLLGILALVLLGTFSSGSLSKRGEAHEST